MNESKLREQICLLATSMFERVLLSASIVLEQLYDEPIIAENKGEIGEEFNSVNLDEYVGKLFSLYPDTTTELNEIEL